MFSLSIQCVSSMNITGGIYRWRYASNVQLLFCTLTTVIFPDVHVISKSQPTCGTAQKSPQLQAALLDLIDEDRGGPLTTPRQDACVARSSPVFVFRPEDPRDGPSPCLLLTSASLLLTSCLRAPSATGPKVVSPTHRKIRTCPFGILFFCEQDATCSVKNRGKFTLRSDSAPHKERRNTTDKSHMGTTREPPLQQRHLIYCCK